MTGNGLAAFSTAFAAVLGSLFPCKLVIGATTVTLASKEASRSPWRKFGVREDIGGGIREVNGCRVRVLRESVEDESLVAATTTAYVDDVECIVAEISDIKNDTSLTLTIRAVDP